MTVPSLTAERSNTWHQRFMRVFPTRTQLTTGHWALFCLRWRTRCDHLQVNISYYNTIKTSRIEGHTEKEIEQTVMYDPIVFPRQLQQSAVSLPLKVVLKVSLSDCHIEFSH